MTTFADVLLVKQLESHKYTVNLEHEWCIGTGKTPGIVGVMPC